MKILLAITFALIIGTGNIKEGESLDKAIEYYGEPSFDYDKKIKQGEWEINFQVYGWDCDTIWYGIQAQNDIIMAIYQFNNEENYLEFITFLEELK